MRERIKELLASGDYGGVAGLFEQSGNRALRHLISISYDMEDALAWRAMGAVGEISARLNDADTRELAQKVLWMMREESGSNAPNAPVILGEIIARNPGGLDDLVPVLGSFFEEEFFRPGVAYALTRIAETSAGDVRHIAPQVLEHIDEQGPAVKGNLVLLVARLGLADYAGLLDDLKDDGSRFTRFDGETLVELTVGEAARDALRSLSAPG